MKPDLIDRREVMAMFTRMTLRRFKRTQLYRLLLSIERKETRKTVFYPRAKLNQALRLAGYEKEF